MSGDISLSEVSADHRKRARERAVAAYYANYSPPPALSVSEWADDYRVLSPKASAIHGDWSTDRTPYLREPMDMLSANNGVERVVVMKGHQLGFTEVGNNWIGYTIDHAPGPMLAMMPSMGLVKRNTRLRIDPLIEACPRLQSKIALPQSKDGANTVEQKDFPGGSLMMCGANSPNPLSSVPIKYLFLDEVDRYPIDVGGEGDPVSLAENRTTSFVGRGRKIFMVSTPKIAGVSLIQREFERSDQRRYFVPCPHCMHMQWLQFKQFKWDKGKPETIRFYCEECDEPVDERHKPWMLANGEWRPTAEGDGITVGYQISSLYSPFASWPSIAVKVVQAKDQPLKQQVVANQEFGEPWRDTAEAPEWRTLYDRAEDRKRGVVPMRGVMLTAGADVQKDRIEVSIWAWGRRREAWLVDHLVLHGSPDQTDVWNELTDVLNQSWPHESGGDLSILTIAVDTGYATQDVYRWIRMQPRKRVMAVKGVDWQDMLVSSGKSVEVDIGGKRIKRGVFLFTVSTGTIKRELYGYFALQPPTAESGDPYPYGYRHFPQMGEEYFKQICGEQLLMQTDKRGKRRYGWHQTYSNVEALDCYVYARAAASLRGRVDADKDGVWQRHEAILGVVADRTDDPQPKPSSQETPPQTPQPKNPPPAKSKSDSWFGKRGKWF